MRVGPLVVNDYTAEPDPMRLSDVKSREEMVYSFDRLRFPHKPNRINQMNGITTITDQEGNVSVSMNCPYPLRPTQESPVRGDSSLPVPFTDAPTTRIFYAAYLRRMGFESEFIAKALAFQPRPATEIVNGIYNADSYERIMSELRSIPALHSYFSSTRENLERVWTPPVGVTASPEDVYKAIMTTAQLQPDGNITFDINPPQQPQTSLVPGLPQ